MIRYVGVSNLALTIKFITRIPGSRGLRGALYWLEQNVLTSSHRRLTLPVPMMIKTRSRVYKRAREGVEAPRSLIRGGGGYNVESQLSLGLVVVLWPPSPSPVRRSI